MPAQFADITTTPKTLHCCRGLTTQLVRDYTDAHVIDRTVTVSQTAPIDITRQHTTRAIPIQVAITERVPSAVGVPLELGVAEGDAATVDADVGAALSKQPSPS